MVAVGSLTVLILLLDLSMSSAETLIINTPEDVVETLSLQDDKTIIKRTGSHHGTGTGCVVKGSYCQCHYCKCEKGHIHCGGYGHKGGYGGYHS